jgi:hypothetical protein
MFIQCCIEITAHCRKAEAMGALIISEPVRRLTQFATRLTLTSCRSRIVDLILRESFEYRRLYRHSYRNRPGRETDSLWYGVAIGDRTSL